MTIPEKVELISSLRRILETLNYQQNLTKEQLELQKETTEKLLTLVKSV